MSNSTRPGALNTDLNDTGSNDAGSNDTIWQFIPISEFAAPTEPPAEQIRTGLMSFWGRLRSGTTTLTPEQEQEQEEADEQRETIEQDVAQLADWPAWLEPATAALDQALKGWRTAADDRAGSRILVSPPHSKVDSILEAWAKKHDYRILEPPTYAQILQSPDEWLEKLPLESGARFVIVELERCYLRHYNGLDLVRRLAQRIWKAQLPCVLGCNSWAWTYLDFACRVGILDSSPLTLAPLDAHAISRWIATTRPTREPYTFRRTDTGIEVYPIHARNNAEQDNPEQSSDEKEHTEEFLVHVAAHARGNPGVIWALWRKALTIFDRHAVEDKARAAAQNDNEATAWVKKWETIDLPAVPTTLSDSGTFALHALLLHDGLRFEEIEYLVPGVSTQLASDLRTLQAAQIVAIDDERFYVTPLGYPTARVFLAEESFLVDGIA